MRPYLQCIAALVVIAFALSASASDDIQKRDAFRSAMKEIVGTELVGVDGYTAKYHTFSHYLAAYEEMRRRERERKGLHDEILLKPNYRFLDELLEHLTQEDHGPGDKSAAAITNRCRLAGKLLYERLVVYQECRHMMTTLQEHVLQPEELASLESKEHSDLEASRLAAASGELMPTPGQRDQLLADSKLPYHPADCRQFTCLVKDLVATVYGYNSWVLRVRAGHRYERATHYYLVFDSVDEGRIFFDPVSLTLLKSRDEIEESFREGVGLNLRNNTPEFCRLSDCGFFLHLIFPSGSAYTAELAVPLIENDNSVVDFYFSQRHWGPMVYEGATHPDKFDTAYALARKHPDSALYQNLLGNLISVYERWGSLGAERRWDALGAYHKAIALDPEWPSPRLNLAWSKWRMVLPVDLAPIFPVDGGLTSSPRRTPDPERLAIRSAVFPEWDEATDVYAARKLILKSALDDLNQYLAMRPNCPLAHQYRWICNHLLQNYDDARDDWRSMVACTEEFALDSRYTSFLEMPSDDREWNSSWRCDFTQPFYMWLEPELYRRDDCNVMMKAHNAPIYYWLQLQTRFAIGGATALVHHIQIDVKHGVRGKSQDLALLCCLQALELAQGEYFGKLTERLLSTNDRQEFIEALELTFRQPTHTSAYRRVIDSRWIAGDGVLACVAKAAVCALAFRHDCDIAWSDVQQSIDNAIRVVSAAKQPPNLQLPPEHRHGPSICSDELIYSLHWLWASLCEYRDEEVMAFEHYLKMLKYTDEPSKVVLNNLAWSSLSIQPIHDPAKALQWAKQAVAKSPEEYIFLDTLACAYAETGDFENATETEHKALKLAEEAKDEDVARHCRNMIEAFGKKMTYLEWKAKQQAVGAEE